MIYADGMHGRFRLGYGAQFIHVAAATAEDRAEIDDLVAKGADPDVRDAGGCSPLHYAAYNNPVSVNGGGIMLHRKRPVGPVAAVQNCTTCSPLSVSARGGRCMAWSFMQRFDLRLSRRD